MIFFQKEKGETPLEMLERFRVNHKEFKNQKLSYAGRLDPMAEGQMLILVGDENKDRQNYLNYDKEYLATFLIGPQTDTGDILGLITRSDFNLISEKEIIKKLEQIKKIRNQKYPWFSSKVIAGLKLFDHYKKGNLQIERPDRKIIIKEIEFLNFENKLVQEIEKYIFESINKVRGDFRQADIKQSWENFFNKIKTQKISTFQTFNIRFVVSTGTYIRSLTENFVFPTTLLKLVRTKILIN